MTDTSNYRSKVRLYADVKYTTNIC